jgi:multiple antibiotic resistance protein
MLAHVTAILVTLLVVIDPLGTVPIFISLTFRQPESKRQQTAWRATIVASVILIAFAIGGDQLLPALGITLPALQISGGILLLAIEMVFAHRSGLRSTTDAETSEAQQRDDVAVFPLAVPLIAGPGAITSSIMLMERAHGNLELKAIILLLILAVLALTYISLRLASRLMSLLGITGINVISRALGIVLAALAIQFMIDGLTGVYVHLPPGH